MRGERGMLIVSQDSLTRIASNPFFPYLLERVEEGIGHGPTQAEVAQRLGAPVGATEIGSTR